MAVTFSRQPQSYSPSDSDLTFAFTSTNESQTNFSFIVKVFVNGNNVSNRQVYPLLSGDGAYYNAVNEGINYTSIPELKNGNIFESANNSAEIYIEVYERYGATPTTQPTPYTSNSVVVWKAKIEETDFQFYLQSQFENKFITSFEGDKKVRVDEAIYFMVLNKKQDFDLTIRVYNSAGTNVNNVTLTRTNNDEFTIINVSPLILIENTTINFNDVGYYTIECDNGFTAPLKRIDINTSCKSSTGMRLHWISALGSPEAFSFDLVSRVKNSFESFGFKKQYNSRQVDPNYQGRDVNTVKRREKTFELESNWLTDSESIYISEDLVFSPVIFLETDGLGLTRVKCMSNQSEPKTVENDTTFKEKIQISLGTDISFKA